MAPCHQMSIVTPDGYLYDLKLDQQGQRTMIEGEHWDDLFIHYGIQFDVVILVNLEDHHEEHFFNATVIDKKRRQKDLIEAVG